MTKDVKVTGRIPMSVRKQVGKSRSGKNKRRNKQTMKHKRIKKIRTPTREELLTSSSPPPSMSQLVNTKPSNTPLGRSILKRNQTGRSRNKTEKSVRFNLAEGVQSGKFRNARRVKMKTSKKKKSIHNLRSKNRTLKKKGFKIRFSSVQDDKKQEESIPLNQGSNLVERLKNFNSTVTEDLNISRV
jgi:hypothetical protein